MDQSAILTLNTGGRNRPRVSVGPSPVLELVYACFFLNGARRDEGKALDWVRSLRADSPELIEAAADLVDEGDRGKALFAMALELDYADDETPDRFISDVPRLRSLVREAMGSSGQEGAGEEAPWIQNPPDDAWASRAAKVLTELWQGLQPLWAAGGEQSALAATADVEAGLEEHGDILRALPRRHFAQFEAVSESIREAQANGTLRVIPLAFAESGGFHLTAERITAVGFGLYGERLHEEIERQIAEAAKATKAFADPTRLLLLSLIIRFESLSMTVGDLARHVGVSQPTVSGHLKLLREAGLVTLERKGNKAYPRAETTAISKVLADLREVLTPRGKGEKLDR